MSSTRAPRINEAFMDYLFPKNTDNLMNTPT
jgi:hypothetical protein